MKNKSSNKILKTLFFSVFLTFLMFTAGTSVFAAGVKLSSSSVKVEKGDTVSNTLNITLNKTEVDVLRDSMTLTLDGAAWNDYSSEGTLSTNITYKITSDTQMEIHIDPTEKMLTEGCTVSVPLKCRVTYDQTEISVTLSYGIDGYNDNRQVFAKCSYTRAYLSGSIL